eukprot:SAG31_NODE_1473_length_8207_cov_2.716330_6_plen_278_part_00
MRHASHVHNCVEQRWWQGRKPKPDGGTDSGSNKSIILQTAKNGVECFVRQRQQQHCQPFLFGPLCCPGNFHSHPDVLCRPCGCGTKGAGLALRRKAAHQELLAHIGNELLETCQLVFITAPNLLRLWVRPHEPLEVGKLGRAFQHGVDDKFWISLRWTALLNAPVARTHWRESDPRGAIRSAHRRMHAKEKLWHTVTCMWRRVWRAICGGAPQQQTVSERARSARAAEACLDFVFPQAAIAHELQEPVRTFGCGVRERVPHPGILLPEGGRGGLLVS